MHTKLILIVLLFSAAWPTATYAQCPTSRPAQTCRARPRPTVAEVTFPAAYPSVSIDSDRITTMRPHPGTGSHWYVATQEGRIYRFLNNAQASQAPVVLDIRDRVSTVVERGLLGFAFSPQFATDGAMFVSYTTASHSRISRFVTVNGGASFATTQEQVILEHVQEGDAHNGGDLHFGPDGMLYMSFGDDGQREMAQDLTDLRGSIIRIDPFGTSGLPTDAKLRVRRYRIPPDNPYASSSTARPEIWAYGFRNPWRMAIDPANGELWVGDVGDNNVEEVDFVERGRNYGWPHKEGTRCFDTSPCNSPNWTDPVAQYTRAEGGLSVIGGGVYRGSAVPALSGSFVFSEWSTGNVYAVRADHGGAPLSPIGNVDAEFAVVAWGQSVQGELYAATRYGFPRLSPGSGGGNADFPSKLSETGCVDTQDPTRPAASLVPYDVNVELWSDGAAKRRWLAIPNGSRISIASNGHWDLPIGSVLVKEFVADGVRVETRLMMRHDDGDWAGYTYQWDADGRDATLVMGGAVVNTGARPWTIPSSAQCLQCHTEPSGQTLGMETAQLNRASACDPGRGQLVFFQQLGLLAAPPGDPASLPALARTADTTAPLEARARGYLHVQCAHCHRPGSVFASLDLRWQTYLGETGACNVPPRVGDLGVPGARIIMPGDPGRSVLSLRMRATDTTRMPRLGTVQVDPLGTQVVDAWITGLPSTCTSPNEPPRVKAASGTQIGVMAALVALVGTAGLALRRRRHA